MLTAKLGLTVLVADKLGDRPAIVVKYLGPQNADLTVFAPLPEHEKNVRIHGSRHEALGAELNDGKRHAYWA
jgi:hypothetical protein